MEKNRKRDLKSKMEIINYISTWNALPMPMPNFCSTHVDLSKNNPSSLIGSNKTKLLLLLLLFVITYMQGIYNYMPEINHVFRV